jgi:hypothetical protein
MTSQEMINDSVAQLIRQAILSMLVCWQRLQETFSNQESVGLLCLNAFSIFSSFMANKLVLIVQ